MSHKGSDLLSEVLRSLEYNKSTGQFFRKIHASSNARAGDLVGCPTRTGYLRVGINGRLHYLHRLAWLVCYGQVPKGLIDHIDGNVANNRISNLRNATHAENLQNLHRPTKAGSGLRGAYFEKGTSKWVSKIGVNGKNVHIGTFASAAEAHEAYKSAKRKFHKFSPEINK